MILIVKNAERYKEYHNKHPWTHHFELLLTFYLMPLKYLYMNGNLILQIKLKFYFSFLLSLLPPTTFFSPCYPPHML